MATFINNAKHNQYRIFIYWFTYQNSEPLEIDNNVNLTLIIG